MASRPPWNDESTEPLLKEDLMPLEVEFASFVPRPSSYGRATSVPLPMVELLPSLFLWSSYFRPSPISTKRKKIPKDPFLKELLKALWKEIEKDGCF